MLVIKRELRLFMFLCFVSAKYNPSYMFLGDLPAIDNPRKILRNCSSAKLNLYGVYTSAKTSLAKQITLVKD